MLKLQYLLPYQTLCCRLFSTSLSRLGQKPLNEQAVLNYRGPRFELRPHVKLAKMLFMKKKRPSFYSRPPVGLSSIPIETVASTVIPSHVASSKRVLVLNKLFMRYVPEILATTDYGTKLYGYDVQFSHVKMAANFASVKVYWIPKGNEKDDEVEKLLNEVAAPLRQEMITLRVMGIVPPIRFLKNKFHALMAEVDRRLKIADFGEDFVPTIFTEDILKRQLQLQAPLPVEVKDQLMQLEDEKPIQDDEELKIPAMKMDIFNLDCEKIRRRIMLSMKNKRIAKLALSDEKTLLGDSAVTEVTFKVDVSNSEPLQKTAFLKYLKKVKNERKKVLKEQVKELERQNALDSILLQSIYDDEEDELYTNFVKNAFEDDYKDFDNELRQEL